MSVEDGEKQKASILLKDVSDSTTTWKNSPMVPQLVSMGPVIVLLTYIQVCVPIST